MPRGDTLLRAMIRATSSAGLVNVPWGGNVDSVLTFFDHFLGLVLARVSAFVRELVLGFARELVLVLACARILVFVGIKLSR